MLIDPAVVTAIFQGIVLLLGGLASLIAVMGRRSGVRTSEYNRTRDRLLVALAYIYRLGEELAERGIPVPPRPDGLDLDDEEQGPRAPRQ